MTATFHRIATAPRRVTFAAGRGFRIGPYAPSRWTSQNIAATMMTTPRIAMEPTASMSPAPGGCSVPPKILEPIGGKLAVPDGVLNVLMAEVML